MFILLSILSTQKCTGMSTSRPYTKFCVRNIGAGLVLYGPLTSLINGADTVAPTPASAIYRQRQRKRAALVCRHPRSVTTRWIHCRHQR